MKLNIEINKLNQGKSKTYEKPSKTNQNLYCYFNYY